MVVMVRSGAVRQHADVAVKLNQLETGFRSALFQRRHGPGRATFGEFGLAVNRRVVEHKLAVERDHTTIAQQRQRVNLEEFGVVCAVRRIEPIENLRDMCFRRAKIESFEHAGDVGRIRPAINIEQQTSDGVGLRCGNFFDVHAAFGGEQDQRSSRHKVMQNGSVEFVRKSACSSISRRSTVKPPMLIPRICSAPFRASSGV